MAMKSGFILKVFIRRNFTIIRWTRAAASARVLVYHSSIKLLEHFFTTRVLVTFYFRLQISISVAVFCSQLMNHWNLWKPIGALRFHLQLASLEIDMNM